MKWQLFVRLAVVTAVTTVTTGAAVAVSGADAAGAAEPARVFAPGVISTEVEEYRIVFDAGGNTAYFGRSQEFFPAARQATIMVTHKTDGVWCPPVPAPFSGVHSDLDPFVTPDGGKLFFSSIRPVGGVPRTDVDLWVVDRVRDGWGEPRHLGAVNSEADELYPSVAADGTLYFASDRTGGFDIYRSRPLPDGTYGPAENLGAPINTGAWEFNPVVLPAGDVLLFTGLNRDGGAGLGDIWASFRGRTGWSTPKPLGGAINTAADEYHLSFSPRYDRVYFVRHTYDPWVPGDIYTLPVWRLL
ncbi:MAG: hypothetical protein HOV79_02070 [Hamadaea sp.]|nr:hypothetical protein [Hamadaea sp.]